MNAATLTFHFISDEEIWLDMLKKRNQHAHIYNEDIAAELVNLIFDKYLPALVNLRDELKRRTESFLDD